MKEQFLSSLIEAAKSGDESALSELSLIALGGNEQAQSAIAEIDNNASWKPVDYTTTVSTARRDIVWPGQDQSGWQGPKKGDVPLHNNV